jgi:hypothetical protein
MARFGKPSDYHSGSRESWLPPEEVLKQCTHAQQELLGKTPRSLKRKTLNVFKLVPKTRVSLGVYPWKYATKNTPAKNSKYRSHLYDTYARAFELLTGIDLITAERLEADTGLEVLGTDSYGSPIFADKWYLLHE